MTAQVPDDIGGGGGRGDALCPDAVASARTSENVNGIFLPGYLAGSGDPGALGTDSSLNLCLGPCARSGVHVPTSDSPTSRGGALGCWMSH